MGEMAVNVISDVLDGKELENTFFAENVLVTKDNVAQLGGREKNLFCNFKMTFLQILNGGFYWVYTI